MKINCQPRKKTKLLFVNTEDKSSILENKDTQIMHVLYTDDRPDLIPSEQLLDFTLNKCLEILEINMNAICSMLNLRLPNSLKFLWIYNYGQDMINVTNIITDNPNLIIFLIGL